MIGRLRGEVARKAVESVLIDVGGVGYEVVCPLTVLDELPREGQQGTLSIHTYVREDQITLFGFLGDEQRALFRMLIGVNNVGPKLALACLSAMTPDQFSEAIASEDLRKLSGIPGVGKRTAERLVLELREKVQKVTIAARSPSPASGHLDDLESALRNLGYKGKAVDQLIEGLRDEAGELGFEGLLREALRRLNK